MTISSNPAAGSVRITSSGPTRDRYSRLARVLHWATAALIFLLVPLGLWGHWLGKSALHDLVMDYWHKPLGLVVIVLTLVRLSTSTRRSARPGYEGRAHWEVYAARVAHGALYVLLLLVPLSGVMMSQGAGKPIMFFGLFTLPQLLPLTPGLSPPEQYWFKLGKILHTSVLDWVLYAGVVIHIAGVIKHQFVDGDRTFISKMWSLQP